jgi:curved DNA-binding protein CbpA
MTDYYDILGLAQSATSIEIRAAYKKLAMEFHPDRNPDNPAAEEKFKLVNEAYHILSDPLKKSRYDSRINSHYAPTEEELYWQQVRRARYAQWKRAQQPRYVFGKEYFKIQGLAFLVFLIISGFCFAVIHTVNYFYALKQQEIHEQNLKLVAQVNALFVDGKIDDAFEMIRRLREEYPLYYEFTIARDSLVHVLRNRANNNYKNQLFREAATDLKKLNKYEFPPRIETLEKLSASLFRSAQYAEATVYLKQLYATRPWDVEVVYEIGAINAVYLNDHQEALKYFTLGKKLFKENLSHAYGNAFEVVMNPDHTPEIYFQLFLARAKANMALGNYTEAEKDCNWAIFLRSEQAEPYKLRAINKTFTKSRGLCNDIKQAKKYGEDVRQLQKKYCR